MNTPKVRYRRHRFPPEIISYSVWASHRFALSFRDVENLLAGRGNLRHRGPLVSQVPACLGLAYS